MDKCSECGCEEGYSCQSDESCKKIEQTIIQEESQVKEEPETSETGTKVEEISKKGLNLFQRIGLFIKNLFF